jgi:hypothetical protein
LLAIVGREIEQLKEGEYINSPDAQKAFTDTLTKLRELFKEAR